MSIITVRPGETITVIGMAADPNAPRPSHPIALPGDPWWGGGGPVDPGYSPPWAQVPPGQGPGGGTGIWGPTDPRPTNPIAGWDPATGTWPDKPPPTEPPAQDQGNWVWAWSPQAGRWVWVKVPGEGEAGPKAA